MDSRAKRTPARRKLRRTSRVADTRTRGRKHGTCLYTVCIIVRKRRARMLNLAILLEDSAREVPKRTAIVCEEGSPELPCVLRMGRNYHRPQASFLAPARTSVLYCSCAKAPCCVTKHSWHTGLSVSQGETARGLPAQAANWVPDDKVREYLAARVKQRIE